MNGAGNAFILIDARGAAHAPSPSAEQVHVMRQARAFDQLIVLSDGADGRLTLRFWNSDGGEVDACGNGTRAAAWHVFEGERARAVIFDTAAGPRSARRLANGEAEVDLGPPRLHWREIPLAREMDTRRLDFAVEAAGVRLEAPGAASMGNPHAVFFVEDVDALPLERLGPAVEHDALFPERVNAGFAQVQAPDEIRLRVWERGAGLTLACGTGACAALVAGHRRGLVGRRVRVLADGGRLSVRWAGEDEAGAVLLSGPVERDGELDLAALL